MLNLHSPSPDRWLKQVHAHLEEILIDHAHCEKKAAGVAMNLLFAYVDEPEVARSLSAIVVEELEHFNMVLSLIERRGIVFRKLPPSHYGAKLHELIRKLEPGRAVDRMLVAGLIEARSCERFGILRDQLPDRELAAFFGGLFESEARHHSAYLKLARLFASEKSVEERLRELSEAEAAIIAVGDERPRIHS